ncbi:MAG: YbjN domain-containing protein [Pseudomonadota bacterium]
MRFGIAMAALGVACGAVFSSASSAQDATVTGGMTIGEVAAIMAGEGLLAEIAAGGEAGKVQSAVSGADFEVFSFNCNEASRCTEFLFITGFDLPEGFPLEQINDWNARKTGGRAYLDDERDPFLDHVISVSGPIDSGAFVEGLYFWAAALDAYIDYIELPSNSI